MDEEPGRGRADIRLDGDVAFVTGAGNGIGRSLALGLGEHGAAVVAGDVDLPGVEAVAARIEGRGGRAVALEVDVVDRASVDRAVRVAVERFGRLDVLVNNAAVATTQMVRDLPEADWRRVLDVNLTGPFICAQAVLPQMTAQGRGRIINVASVAAKRISYNAAASYTASKAGLLAFTRHLAYEVAPDGINVNAVCPGPTLTPMMAELADPATLQARQATVPRGRLTIPEDHLAAVLFLASDLSDMICGVALDVDGGALLGWSDVGSYRERRRARG